MLNGTFSVHLSLFLWAPIRNASFFGDKFHSESQCTGHNYELAFTRFPVSFSKQTKYRPARKLFELKQIFINDDCFIVFNPSSFENVSVVIVGENVCRFFSFRLSPCTLFRFSIHQSIFDVEVLLHKSVTLSYCLLSFQC